MADIIVLNEITELLNSVNGSLSTSVSNVKSVVDTINTNVNTVKTATAVNNTASTTGTLSQKMSSAIANTATNNTASKTGILSQKLAYVISLLENSTYGLNALKSSGGSKVYKPSTSLLATVLSKEVAVDTADTSSNRYNDVLYFGKFEPQYDGVVKIVFKTKCGAYNSSYNIMFGTTLLVFSWDTYPLKESGSSGGYNTNLYTALSSLETSASGTTTFVNTNLSLIQGNGTNYSKAYIYTTGKTDYVESIIYLPVVAGNTIYFTSFPEAANDDYGYLYHVSCNSIKIYATAS